METLRKKLNSQSGASIIMALLLFLVCAVIGSLVLTAATAAAGTKAAAEQSDQRYYSVDSAAGLVRDLVTEESVTVQRTKTQVTDVTDSLVKDEEGNVVWEDSDTVVKDPSYSLTFPDFDTELARERDLLVFAAQNLIPGYDDIDENFGFDSEILGSGESKTFSVSTSPGLINETDTSFLDVKIKMTVAENGELIFIISSGETKPYTLRETFRLLYSESTSKKTSEGKHTVEEVAENEYTDIYSVTTTTTKEGTFQWEFVSCSVE